MRPSDDRAVLEPVANEADLGLVDGLAQLTFAVHGVLARIAAANGLSVVQARLLGILRDRQPTINELAGFLQLDKSSVTGLVDRAEGRGLVRRARSTVDGRSVHVSITDSGRCLLDQATSAFGSEVADLVADLTAAQRDHLSVTSTIIVAADGRRRGTDIFAIEPSQTEP